MLAISTGGNGTGSVDLWDPNSGEFLAKVTCLGVPQRMVMNSTCTRLAHYTKLPGFLNRCIEVWDLTMVIPTLETPTCNRIFLFEKLEFSDMLAFNGSGSQLVVVAYDVMYGERVYIHSMDTGHCINTFCLSEIMVACSIAFGGNDDKIIVGYTHGTMKVYNATSSSLSRWGDFEAPSIQSIHVKKFRDIDNICCLHGNRFACVYDYTTVVCWNYISGSRNVIKTETSGYSSEIRCICFGVDDNMLITGHGVVPGQSKDVIILWKIISRESVLRILMKVGVTAISFNRSANTIIVAMRSSALIMAFEFGEVCNARMVCEIADDRSRVISGMCVGFSNDNDLDSEGSNESSSGVRTSVSEDPNNVAVNAASTHSDFPPTDGDSEDSENMDDMTAGYEIAASTSATKRARIEGILRIIAKSKKNRSTRGGENV
jgi:WD40 repeat protein